MTVGKFNEVIYEEAMTSLYELWDFKVCQRHSDGSYYGTADSNTCRVGTETNSADKEVSREDRLKDMGIKGKRAATASVALDKLSDEEFVRVTDAAADILTIKPQPKLGMMTAEEHQMLVKNEEFNLEAYENPKKYAERFRETSDAEADALLALTGKKQFYPDDVHSRIAKAEGYAEAGDKKAASKLPDEVKEQLAHDLAKRWLQQDGRDIYTGRKINIVEAELEHIQPLDGKNGLGPGPKGADNIRNFAYIDRAVNLQKGGRTMDEFYNTAVRRYSKEEQQARHEAAGNAKGAKAAARESAKVDAAKIKGHADEMIKKYGPNGVNYLAEAMGYKRYYQFPGRAGETRGSNIWGNYKMSNGKKERLENIVIRNEGKWSASDKKKAMELFQKMGSEIASGTNPAQARQNYADALQKI